MSTNEESVAAWRKLAAWWDARSGPRGTAFHREVVAPATEKLLAPRAGELVLDIGCGNGQFARRLAAMDVRVVAFDVSEPFVERARAHGESPLIEYLVLDATDEKAVRALGEGRFDGAVANMALMDIADAGATMRAVARVLTPGGRFVFTVIHPSFGYAVPLGRAGGLIERGAALASRVLPGPTRHAQNVIDRLAAVRHAGRYLASRPRRGIGIRGQPVAHWYFHRPLEALLAPAFDAGLVLDGLAEPAHRDAPERALLLAVRLRRPR